MKNKLTIAFIFLSTALFAQRDTSPTIKHLNSGYIDFVDGKSARSAPYCWPLSPPDTLTYWFSPTQWERMLKAEADSVKWTDGRPYVARVLLAPNNVQFTKLCTGTTPCTDFEDNRLVCQIIIFNGVDKITDLPKKN